MIARIVYNGDTDTIKMYIRKKANLVGDIWLQIGIWILECKNSDQINYLYAYIYVIMWGHASLNISDKHEYIWLDILAIRHRWLLVHNKN
jgi:hypothetical protein